MHAVEKILAKASGKERVSAGDFVQAKVDVVMIHDRGWDLTFKGFNELGVRKVHDPEAIAFILDHWDPPLNPLTALKLKSMRDFAREQGIRHIYDVGEGICHVILPEKGHVWPGAIVLGTDSHTPTNSALGCIASGVGKSDAGTIMAIGSTWLKVPETVKFNIFGKFSDMVMARDVAQFILGKWGTRVAQYKVAEFAGPAIRNISMDGRFCLCNLATEMGAMTGFIEVDQITNDYAMERVVVDYRRVKTDPAYEYSETYDIDVTELEPQVACPHNPDIVKPVSEVEATKIDSAGIGTCAGGRIEDLRVAASILKGKEVAPDVRMQVIPGSREIYAEALREGLIEIFLKAGVMIGVPSCWGCGVLYRAPGYTSIHTGPRNFRGRGGDKDSFSYNASPATVAASAIAGEITDPRKYAR